MDKETIIEKIDDLIKQANEEKSHYYTKSVLVEAKEFIQSQTQDIIKKVEGMKIEFIPYTKYTGLLSDKVMEKQKMINHGERCYNKAIQKFNQALSDILKEL